LYNVHISEKGAALLLLVYQNKVQRSSSLYFIKKCRVPPLSISEKGAAFLLLFIRKGLVFLLLVDQKKVQHSSFLYKKKYSVPLPCLKKKWQHFSSLYKRKNFILRSFGYVCIILLLH